MGDCSRQMVLLQLLVSGAPRKVPPYLDTQKCVLPQDLDTQSMSYHSTPLDMV